MTLGHVVGFSRDLRHRENGYRQVLTIAVPLVLSMGSLAIMIAS